MKSYNHIFFDLDHTLWDFKSNMKITLDQIYVHFGLARLGNASVQSFIDIYTLHNIEMWSAYRNGRMGKETMRKERFRQTLRKIGVRDKILVSHMSEYYCDLAPRQVNLIPDAISVLRCLAAHYKLHIITNGFSSVQYIKLNSSGLLPFFNQVITSQVAGVMKPHPAIFHYALKKSGANAKESLMVGDQPLVDIRGAAKVGMDGVYFNPEGLDCPQYATYQISELRDLYGILLDREVPC